MVTRWAPGGRRGATSLVVLHAISTYAIQVREESHSTCHWLAVLERGGHKNTCMECTHLRVRNPVCRRYSDDHLLQ